MQTIRFADMELSRMMLGTVQLGLPYGIANQTGQPDQQAAQRILAAAAEGGVNCLDTAASYGASEEVLGRALQVLGLATRMIVVTKVRPLTAEEQASPRQAADAITRSVDESRRRLRLDCLPMVLFHREADAVHLDVLERLKARGWLRHAGVSCDNQPEGTSTLIAHPAVSALQIPGSILDRRHAQHGNLCQAAQRGTAVFLRSVFLQGLLLLPEERIPAHLQAVLPARRRLAALAAEAGCSLSELAVRYMLGRPGVTCALIGVETLEQVRENLALFRHGPLPPDVEAAVEASAPDIPAAVLTPSMWPALAAASTR